MIISKRSRVIPSAPLRALDAPGLVDDDAVRLSVAGEILCHAARDIALERGVVRALRLVAQLAQAVAAARERRGRGTDAHTDKKRWQQHPPTHSK